MYNLVCARCFTAPKEFLGLKERHASAYRYCSERCLNHEETPVVRAARTGIALMNADLMFHMFLSIGRDDDDNMKVIQERRMLCASLLQELAKTPELEAVAL
jgi:hypothetical protein